MKIELSKDEIKAIISALEHEEEMYEFVRGFGKKTNNQIMIKNLINKLLNK